MNVHFKDFVSQDTIMRTCMGDFGGLPQRDERIHIRGTKYRVVSREFYVPEPKFMWSVAIILHPEGESNAE